MPAFAVPSQAGTLRIVLAPVGGCRMTSSPPLLTPKLNVSFASLSPSRPYQNSPAPRITSQPKTCPSGSFSAEWSLPSGCVFASPRCQPSSVHLVDPMLRSSM